MKYSISYEPSTEKELRKIEKQFQVRIRKAIEDLSNDPRPHGCIKLSGVSGNYRIKVGAFRIIYSINDNALIIRIIEVGDRKNVYR